VLNIENVLIDRSEKDRTTLSPSQYICSSALIITLMDYLAKDHELSVLNIGEIFFYYIQIEILKNFETLKENIEELLGAKFPEPEISVETTLWIQDTLFPRGLVITLALVIIFSILNFILGEQSSKLKISQKEFIELLVYFTSTLFVIFSFFEFLSYLYHLFGYIIFSSSLYLSGITICYAYFILASIKTRDNYISESVELSDILKNSSYLLPVLPILSIVMLLFSLVNGDLRGNIYAKIISFVIPLLLTFLSIFIPFVIKKD
jgi:hypothetical protein